MYQRVLPRDLFNEAKLLKCLGQLCLQIHEGLAGNLTFEYLDPEQGFDIYQDQNSGDTYCDNLFFYLNKEIITFSSGINSRENWPLVVNCKEDIYFVFNKDGKFTEFFKQLIHGYR